MRRKSAGKRSRRERMWQSRKRTRSGWVDHPGCTGKVKIHDLDRAYAVAQTVMRNSGQSVVFVYSCPTCDRYHLSAKRGPDTVLVVQANAEV